MKGINCLGYMCVYLQLNLDIYLEHQREMKICSRQRGLQLLRVIAARRKNKAILTSTRDILCLSHILTLQKPISRSLDLSIGVTSYVLWDMPCY